MLFFSPFAALQVLIRPEAVFYHPTTGVETHRVKALRAEFAQQLGNEYAVKDPVTNLMTTAATIIGNYFDTGEAAKQHGWTEEEQESVETRLLWLCGRRPDLIKHVEHQAPVVMAPWPTYDDGDAEEAVLLAKQLGLVPEALAYERVNARRPVVVEALEEVLAANVDDETGEPVDTGPLRNVVEPERPVLEPAKGGESRVMVF